jgi:hypothetical protein
MDQSLVQHKCVVTFNTIQIDIARPIQCIFKYKFELFSKKEVRTPMFNVKPGKELQKIPYTCRRNTFIIPSKFKEVSIQHVLENQLLHIKVFDLDLHIGNCKVNLNRIYNKEYQQKRYFLEKLPITNEDETDTKRIIGAIEFSFVLVPEECIKCKQCEMIFKVSGILQHLAKKQKCKDSCSDEEMDALKKNALKRYKQIKNQRNAEREFEKYDPKERAKIHKRTYDAKKRSERHEGTYDKLKRRNKYEKDLNNIEQGEKIERLEEHRNNALKSAIEDESEARERNRYLLSTTQQDYELWVNKFNKKDIPDEIQTKIKDIECSVVNFHQKFEQEIDKLKEKVELAKQKYGGKIPFDDAGKEDFKEQSDVILKMYYSFFYGQPVLGSKYV